MTTEDNGIRELAGGWITERKNTPIPAFLKLSYVGFCLFGLYYLYRYWMGETDHESRGALVQQLNQAMGTPAAAWHLVLFVILAAFVVGLLAFAFLGREHED